MSAVDHVASVAELQQHEKDARAELRRRLLEGGNTAEARAAIVEFGRSLQAEVARIRLDAEEKAEAKRVIRETGRRQLAAKLSSAARADIAKRTAHIAIPTPLKDAK